MPQKVTLVVNLTGPKTECDGELSAKSAVMFMELTRKLPAKPLREGDTVILSEGVISTWHYAAKVNHVSMEETAVQIQADIDYGGEFLDGLQHIERLLSIGFERQS